MAAYAGAGVPIYWIVDAVNRTVEVCSRPMSLAEGPAYGERVTFREGEAIAVVIDDQPRSQVNVGDLFPPA